MNTLRNLAFYLVSWVFVSCSPAADESSATSESESESGFEQGQASTTVTGANLTSASGECEHTNKTSEFQMITASCRLIIRDEGAALALAEDGFEYATSVDGVTWNIDLGEDAEKFICSFLMQATRIFCFSETADNFAPDFAVALTLTSTDNGDSVTRQIISIKKNATTIPLAASGSDAVAATSSTVNVSWTDNADDETLYKIKRSTDNVNYTDLATLASDLEAYSDNTVSPSTSYYYKIQPCNTAGCAADDETGIVTTPASSQRIFITSTTYNGNLGGLAGADAKCQTRADAASLGGTWKAALTTSTAEASSHVSIAGEVRNLNNDIVASNASVFWAAVTTSNAVNYTELMEVAAGMLQITWTGREDGGGVGSTITCNDWIDASGGETASTGLSGNDTFFWEVDSATCDDSLSLFCVDGQ